MTPDQFTERNPNWKADVSRMCAAVFLGMIQDPDSPCPLPWDDEQIAAMEDIATRMTIDVFAQYRDQMGEVILGELVLFVGQEAKRLALVARDGPEGMLQ